jgi:hypothetical protein
MCGVIREMILNHHPRNLRTLTNHDLGIKGKPSCQFRAQARLGDGPPNEEGVRCADVVVPSLGVSSRGASQNANDVGAVIFASGSIWWLQLVGKQIQEGEPGT